MTRDSSRRGDTRRETTDEAMTRDSRGRGRERERERKDRRDRERTDRKREERQRSEVRESSHTHRKTNGDHAVTFRLLGEGGIIGGSTMRQIVLDSVFFVPQEAPKRFCGVLATLEPVRY